MKKTSAAKPTKKTAIKSTPKKPASAAAKTTKRASTPPPRKSIPKETAEARRQRAGRVLAALKTTYPDATCALHHRSALELLVATILSAQCTDERVNMVTPNLFRRYPDARAYAAADVEELETLIRSTGFYHNKAKNLIGMGKVVCEQFGGTLPDRMDDLLKLPGVARKTANCVLGTWFGRNDGVVVDTHVGRLTLRLGLATTARDDKDAVRIEQELMELFPQDSWTYLSHALILHGRRLCQARKPNCELCPLAPDCPSAGTFH